nr:MAG TPA: hypothetical protein [Caudoviricetes sp.]
MLDTFAVSIKTFKTSIKEPFSLSPMLLTSFVLCTYIITYFLYVVKHFTYFLYVFLEKNKTHHFL